MIEKIKHFLSDISFIRRISVRCTAVFIVFSITTITLLGNSVKTFNIFDGISKYKVHTFSNNISAVVSALNLKSKNFNILSAISENGITSVVIKYAFPVYITNADKTSEIEFTGGTVADALKAAGFTADEYDFVEPSLDTVINETTYIDYTNIDYVSGSYTEAIPYTLDVVYSSNIPAGTTSVSGGADGVQQVSYTDKLVNGVLVEKNVTDISVISNAVNTVKTIGTKSTGVTAATSADIHCISTLVPDFSIELDNNGCPVNYKSVMTVKATAYTYTGRNCSTGVAPQPGYIAVNPKVIPYGTKMYIKSSDGKYIYGYAVAADTGGFIKKRPNGVDLFMPTESDCVNFGVRNVEIYILE